MPSFKSWRSFWHFETAVKNQTRYVYDAEVRDFLDAVLSSSETRLERFTAGMPFFRAQVGYDWREMYEKDLGLVQEEVPFPPERMTPRRDRAAEGRANPKGITVLYGATEQGTAIAEVRPWIGSLVSVGRFKTVRDIILVNCTLHRGGNPVHLRGEPSALDREDAVWNHIDKAFAKPVERSEDLADYVATQVIAEAFKTYKFDGLAYGSALGAGHNLAFFDPDVARLDSCSLVRVERVTLEWNETQRNPYVVHKPGSRTTFRRGVDLSKPPEKP